MKINYLLVSSAIVFLSTLNTSYAGRDDVVLPDVMTALQPMRVFEPVEDDKNADQTSQIAKSKEEKQEVAEDIKLEMFPDNLQLHILQFLDPHDLFTMAQVSKKYEELTVEGFLWKHYLTDTERVLSTQRNISFKGMVKENLLNPLVLVMENNLGRSAEFTIDYEVGDTTKSYLYTDERTGINTVTGRITDVEIPDGQSYLLRMGAFSEAHRRDIHSLKFTFKVGEDLLMQPENFIGDIQDLLGAPLYSKVRFKTEEGFRTMYYQEEMKNNWPHGILPPREVLKQGERRLTQEEQAHFSLFTPDESRYFYAKDDVELFIQETTIGYIKNIRMSCLRKRIACLLKANHASLE